MKKLQTILLENNKVLCGINEPITKRPDVNVIRVNNSKVCWVYKS